MPVSKISIFVDCSVKAGDSLWIGDVGRFFSAGIPSIGSPNILTILPSIFSPTGTLIALPVAVTSSPRLNPSVELIATVLTLLDPKCPLTSKITFLPSKFSTSIDSEIFGRFSLNLTSTIGPIT